MQILKRNGLSSRRNMNLYTVPRARIVPALMPVMQAAEVIIISGGANLPGLHLYNKLVRYFIVRVQSLKNHSDSLHDEAFLRYYAVEWDRHTTGAGCINRVFTYLNRTWVTQERHEGRKGVYLEIYFFLCVQNKHTKLTGAIL
ncbi:hypothetical protein M405DRAFT_569803 [Rhizopogon salebrosus TDB-379]|nr:hypothetical protein M405DRAFT_569803 [Rhizopogon salebrosus TDB-379]